MVFDVAVVGAGPGGATAAGCLARARKRVVLIEKESVPRYKTCGGGVVPRAAAMMGVSIEEAIEYVCTKVELHVDAANLHAVIGDGEPLIYMTMRATLDALLLRAAREAGADIMTDCAVTDVSQDAEGVTLTTSRGNVRAGYVIGADGARSITARRAGWKETRTFAPALECEVTVSDADYERLSRTTRFDFDVIPRGYAWVFPKRANHLSIGLGRLRDESTNLHEALARYMKLLKLEPVAMEHHGSVVPISPRRDGLARGRVLLVGDAAGVADPVAAEGISHAIISARLAAEAICEAEPGRAAEVYEAKIEAELMGELRDARTLSGMLYGGRWLRNLVLRWHKARAAKAVADVFSGRRRFSQVLQRRSRLLRYALERTAAR